MVPSVVRATSVGSLPVPDVELTRRFDEATRIVVGELPDLPHVVELPLLGPGADMVGRLGALIGEVSSDLSWETTTDGWRRASAPGLVMRRALSWWRESLDALETHAAGSPAVVKTQACGPWTFASSVEVASGDRALRDRGLVRDIADAWSEALISHVADVHRRITPGEVIVQVDEPALPAVLAGTIPTASGLGRLPAVDPVLVRTVLSQSLTRLHAAGARVVVHCCAREVPLALLHESGADGLSIDLGLHDDRDDEAVGTWVDSGRMLWLGVVPTSPPSGAVQVVDTALRAAERLRQRLGFDPEAWGRSLVVTPTCGLGSSTPGWSRTALGATREVASRLSGAESATTGEA